MVGTQGLGEMLSGISLHGGLSRPLIKVRKHTPDALYGDGTFLVNMGVL